MSTDLVQISIFTLNVCSNCVMYNMCQTLGALGWRSCRGIALVFFTMFAVAFVLFLCILPDLEIFVGFHFIFSVLAKVHCQCLDGKNEQ